MTDRDALYAERRAQITAFQFDDEVAGVFTDMIRRSVPGYNMLLEAIPIIAARYARQDKRIYDLGCSLGAVTLAVGRRLTEATHFIAVDSSEAMIQACERHMALLPSRHRIDLKCADVIDTTVDQACLVIMNFTLQFVDPPLRPTLIERIYNGLEPGGALILSEKLKFDDESDQRLLNELHLDFKKAQGYSDLEISQKRTALENVLVPETLDTHCRRLKDAGFARITPWFQYFNFGSIVAVK